MAEMGLKSEYGIKCSNFMCLVQRNIKQITFWKQNSPHTRALAQEVQAEPPKSLQFALQTQFWF